MISIAIPTYNGERYLREQLDSIYGQTVIPDEIVVVDDCSTDGTVSILDEYKDRYGLKYYINEKNIGYNKNFEKAISLCQGDYIALCDQDDIWLPTKIEKSYKAISKYPQDVPALVSSFSTPNKEILQNPFNNKCKGGDWRHCFLLYYSQGCTLFFNKKLKELVLPLPDRVMYDSHIGLSAALLGNMEYIGEQLMYYRIHQNNAFQTNYRNGLKAQLISNLSKKVPLLHNDKRLQSLIAVRTRFADKANPIHMEYLDKIILMYTTKAYKRIPIVWSFKEIPLLRRSGIVIMLFFKVLLNINDK